MKSRQQREFDEKQAIRICGIVVLIVLLVGFMMCMANVGR